LISIPTVIGLYAGIFQDLLKPLFNNNDALTNEYRLNQMNSVLKLNNVLTSKNLRIKYLFEEDKELCQMTETTKCDSYYEICSRTVNIGKFPKFLNPENYEFEMACQKGVVVAKDSARTLNDSLVYFLKLKNIAEGSCNINFEKETLVYDKNILKFLDAYLNDFYLPSTIKHKIEIITDFKYRKNKMGRIDKKLGQWFLVVNNNEKEFKYTNSEDLVYEIYWRNEKLKFYEFTSLLTNLNFEIQNWMNENDLN
tara:strand:- start:1289 stop:2047 length:759 start_codon:yes stop_codon:yes gene_type:complete